VALLSAVVLGRRSAIGHAKKSGHRNEPINKVYDQDYRNGYDYRR
jgi:hypothetical protein